MSRYLPSIFNDVIGPVMRGPSSSHVAAALRIGQICRDLMGGVPDRLSISYDTAGSLATTHDGQGSDMGLYSGLLGWPATDPRMTEAEAHLKAAGTDITIHKGAFGHSHPNTYELTLEKGAHSCQLTAISTGGGMIEVRALDGIALSFMGDSHETLIICKERKQAEKLADEFQDHECLHQVQIRTGKDSCLLQLTGRSFPENQLKSLSEMQIHRIRPVLPIEANPQTTPPFLTAADMLQRADGRTLWQLALAYESARGGIPEGQVMAMMQDLVIILEESIHQGLAGTRYNDRILPAQAPLFQKARQEGRLLEAGLMNEITQSVTALMDVKSAMGVVIAAPTAGACGTLPGSVIGAARALDLDREKMAQALLAAGMIGIFIAHAATFAAEVGGCQAETGSGAGMAAAALVTLQDGSLDQCLTAASLALQNSFGLVCDPVANRVEAPCLGKNVLMAGNALNSANMALAGFEGLIPLDEVITAMHQVGQALPCELRCTGKGGLSVTPTALKIEQNLKRECDD